MLENTWRVSVDDSEQNLVKLCCTSIRTCGVVRAAERYDIKTCKRSLAKEINGESGLVGALNNSVSYREVTAGSGIPPKTGDTAAIHCKWLIDFECTDANTVSKIPSSTRILR